MALLIVDDEESNRDMLSRRLQRQGFEVALAEDGQQALDSIRAQTPDVVLLDIRMPGMSGMEVLQAIRQQFSPTQLPVIMVTAEGQSGSIVEALRIGANDYITKPVDMPVVLARIRTVLSQKTLAAALRESEERYARAARGANDGLWDWDLEKSEIYYSPRWQEMLGYQEGEIGRRPDEWLCRVHPDDFPRLQAALAAHCRRETPQLDCEHRIHCKNGTYRWMLSRGVAVWNEAGDAIRIAGSQTDITAAKVADPLTGLPNRLLFMDRLERRVELSKRRTAREFAILLLGVDRFKNVNDSLGHLAGDQLLRALGERLRVSLRAADTVARLQEDCGVARLAGDEFAVLLDEIRQGADAVSVAERIGVAMRAPFVLNGSEVFVTASMGIAGGANGYERAEDLMRDADTALHCAKVAGRSRFEIFDTTMRRRAITRLQVETDLRRALERHELRLHYQPIVDLRTGAIAGFEALVRWQHPLRGMISPMEFIPVAEETGLIVPAGHWIIEQACRDVERWLGTVPAGPLLPGGALTLHVNFSPVQFAELGAIDEIERILRRCWPAGRGFGLSFEITESTMMQNSDNVSVLLARLRDLHIGLDIDDFGTGYSSLSQLQHLKVQALKIDRAFVSRIGLDADSLEIIRTIVSLAHTLGIDIIAEGVETAQQLTQLKALGCEYAQGYYFGKPTDREAAWSLIRVPGNLPAASPALPPPLAGPRVIGDSPNP
ncbi:MAG: EAL domain-containing protein [Bryobacteraceae bacterium]|jgi:diguanylate cyclase (GGDEF)-like protein/PAS domain S-box-containing protein